MPIAATRALLHAALSGELDSVDYRTDALFGFEVPTQVPGVDTRLLDPRWTWRDPDAYDVKARELAQMFRANFEKFAGRDRGRRRRPARLAGELTRRTPVHSVAPGGSEARRARGRRRLRRHARRDRGARRGRRRRRRLEAPPDAQPLRRSGGRHQRRARKRGPDDPGDSHLRHGQGLGLPRRPGCDRDPLPRGARTTSTSSSTGARSSRARDDGRLAQRPFGAAGSPRTVTRPTSPATC